MPSVGATAWSSDSCNNLRTLTCICVCVWERERWGEVAHLSGVTERTSGKQSGGRERKAENESMARQRLIVTAGAEGGRASEWAGEEKTDSGGKMQERHWSWAGGGENKRIQPRLERVIRKQQWGSREEVWKLTDLSKCVCDVQLAVLKSQRGVCLRERVWLCYQ